MYSTILVLISILVSFEIHAQGQEFTIDPETSRAIPTFAGKAVMVRGDVFTIYAGKVEKVKIAKGHKFKSGDKIMTAPKSLVQIEMADDTTISLGPKTEFVIEKFDFRTKDDRDSVYGMIVGKMRANFPRKAKPGQLEVKTPTASMGIRGTHLLTNVTFNAANNEVTQMALLEGKVELRNKIKKTSHLILPKMHYVGITKGEGVEEGVLNLDEENYKRLVAAEVDPDKEFKPFLETFAHNSIDPGRGPSSISVPEDVVEVEEIIQIDDSKKYFKSNSGNSWKDKLERLNKTLEKNHN